ncbi:exonuclease domain-containing protein [Micrococcus endophyticus]|uniref:exonuclease domain-containing protein n=1 Tax=Micrococcus endophyticus TaxID=455343 RepID=UPI0035A9940B
MSGVLAPVPGLDFTAIDFETANGFRGSPCALGAVRVRDGVMVERAEWLIRPPVGFDRFDPRNVRIHGITEDRVLDAARFADVYDELAGFVGTDVLAAHNAGFDVGVIESGLEVSGRDVPRLDFVCTLVLARRVYDLASYALPSAAREAGFAPGPHHDALADAEACAAILVDVARRVLGTEAGDGAAVAPAGARGLPEPFDIPRLMRAQGLTVNTLAQRAAGEGPESKATRQARRAQGVFDARVPLKDERAMPDFLRWPDEGTNPVPNPDADPGHPLHGQTVVFTGGIGMSRQTAKVRAARLGAQTANRVGATTTMLVVGDGFEAADLDRPAPAPGTCEAVTTALAHRKTRDALRRRERGQHISLVSEGEFLQMLDGNWPDAAR